MVALTRKEILEELTKLGITNPSELQALCRDYLEYYSLQYR